MLTHWHLNKMATILQTTSSKAFSWMKMFVFSFEIYWCVFIRVQLTIMSPLVQHVQVMVWHWFKWEDITWTNGDHDAWHHMTSPSHNELICPLIKLALSNLTPDCLFDLIRLVGDRYFFTMADLTTVTVWTLTTWQEEKQDEVLVTCMLWFEVVKYSCWLYTT